MNPTQFPLRFGNFEVDPATATLRRGGRPVRLERRPMELLLLLLERRGQLVSRDAIIDRLWGADTFVDAQAGVHTAIRKVRQALRDAVEKPAFVETVPGKGYRFIAVVTDHSSEHRVTIGVLPYANLTGDAAREYIALGLTEEAIVALGHIASDEFRVLGRTATAHLTNTRASLAEVARRVGADYLVEGSVRAVDHSLAVTSRLIKATDGTHIWTGTADGTPTGMARLAADLCRAAAAAARLQLGPEQLAHLDRRQTHHADAYDLYLRGRQLWNLLTPATTAQAVDYFQRAAALDGEYALAWSGIADALAAGPITGDADPRRVAPIAVEAAEHARRAQPGLAEAHASAGTVKFWLEWAWPAAEAALRRAVSLDPHYPFAYRMLGHVLSQTGRHHAARLALRRATDLDPFYAMHHALSAQIAFQARDPRAALDHARHALEVDPRFWIAHLQVAQAHEQLGAVDHALASVDVASTLSSGNSKALSLKGYLLGTAGRHAEARRLRDELADRTPPRYVPPYALALISLGLGDIDDACRWLERAEAERDVHLVFLPVDPKWDVCRADPRVRAIVDRCGFAAADGGDETV